MGLALGGMLSQQYGGMLPHGPARSVSAAGVQPVVDSVGGMDVEQKSPTVSGVYIENGCRLVPGKFGREDIVVDVR